MSPRSTHSATTSSSQANIYIKRRNETFAEAEHRLKIKKLELGILGAGEISGMCELIFDMPSYMQSTRCVESCDVFYIYKRSYDRLIAKRNPNCISKMKDNVLVKLSARNARIPIDLFRSLQYSMELQMKSRPQPTQLVNSLASNFPQRGAFVQLDTHTVIRPRSSLLNRMKQQQQQKQKIIASLRKNETDKSDVGFSSVNPMTYNELMAKSSRKASSHNAMAIEHGTFGTASLINGTIDLTSLEELENKMKQWQLDLGCKKAFVTKLNRIDTTEVCL